MKALTVRQPWATLLVAGIKHMETRTRDTKHRGVLAIHAGMHMPCRIGETIDIGAGFTVERDSTAGLLLRGLRQPYRLPVGAVIGAVELFQTRKTTSGEHGPDNRELALGDHSPGRWAWSTASAIRTDPMPIRGQLGLWNLPDDIAAEVQATWARSWGGHQ